MALVIPRYREHSGKKVDISSNPSVIMEYSKFALIKGSWNYLIRKDRKGIAMNHKKIRIHFERFQTLKSSYKGDYALYLKQKHAWIHCWKVLTCLCSRSRVHSPLYLINEFVPYKHIVKAFFSSTQ